MSESSPIFSKTYQMMMWLLNHTGKFPKSERFRLAKQLSDSLFEFHQCLLELVYFENRSELFAKADVQLARLRIYVRLSQEMGLTSIKQYEFFSGLVTEIGRLLGGWKKSRPVPIS